jgi:hypothetical protein
MLADRSPAMDKMRLVDRSHPKRPSRPTRSTDTAAIEDRESLVLMVADDTRLSEIPEDAVATVCRRATLVARGS